MARTERNQGYKKTRDALNAAGFRCIQAHSLRDIEGKKMIGDIRIYSNGRECLILKSSYDGKEIDGFDVFVPITDSNRVDDTITAIALRANAEAA